MTDSEATVTESMIPVSRLDRFAIPTLVTASTISSVGNGITNLAIPWFVLVTTGSAARTGIAGGLSVLATVISGMLGGAAVDRLGFKRASVISDVLSGITVAIIPTLHFLGVLEFWHLLMLVFVGAIFDAPGSVARQALIPNLVRRSSIPLERANAAMEFANQGSSTLLGPLAAGLLIGFIGAAAVLYVDAGTFALSVLMIGLLIRNPQSIVPEAHETSDDSQPKSSYISDIVAGVKYFLNDDFLAVVLPISILYNFLLSPTIAVALPVLAKDTFDSAAALGIIVGAFGLGSAVGTLAYGAQGHRVSRYWTFMVGVCMMAAGFWFLPLATNIWIAAAGMLILGLAIGPTNVLAITIVQGRVSEEMLGRVFGLLFAASSVAAPLGVFIGGFLIEIIGVRSTMLIAASGTTLATLWVFLSPKMQTVIRKFEISDGEATSEYML